MTNIMPITLLPDPTLRQMSLEVEEVNGDIVETLHSMHETMINAKGIGLAAPQVSIMKRIIVVDLQERDEDHDSKEKLFINPKILETSEQMSEAEEGCLSIPRQFANINRPQSIKISYINKDGQPKELEADGLYARCIQHEIDHLNGVLFIDHLSRLKRGIMQKKAVAIKKTILEGKDAQ